MLLLNNASNIILLPILQAVKASPVVLFMKGTPDSPQCGFSRTVVQILDIEGVPKEKLQTYNVLEDPELRSGIKEYSYVGFLTAVHFVRELRDNILMRFNKII